MNYTKAKAAALQKQPQFDISDEEGRTYYYDGGATFFIDQPKTLILEKRADNNDRHRVIDKFGNGWYVRPGWLAISWFNRKGKPPIKF